jgi:hypothetical protein
MFPHCHDYVFMLVYLVVQQMIAAYLVLLQLADKACRESSENFKFLVKLALALCYFLIDILSHLRTLDYSQQFGIKRYLV